MTDSKAERSPSTGRLTERKPDTDVEGPGDDLTAKRGAGGNLDVRNSELGSENGPSSVQWPASLRRPRMQKVTMG